MSKTTTCWVVKSPDEFYWSDRCYGWEMRREDATRFDTKEEALEKRESLFSETASSGLYFVKPRVVRLVSKHDGVPSGILLEKTTAILRYVIETLSDVSDGINKLDDARTLLVAAEKKLERFAESLKENS